MRLKTILIVIITVMVTIILMNNTDAVTFWIFGDIQVPKLTILGVLFALGFIVGFMARGKRKRLEQEFTIEKTSPPSASTYSDSSDENYSDDDYIK
jgi:uncharacterized membrane protein YciS (DUF1049 family)